MKKNETIKSFIPEALVIFLGTSGRKKASVVRHLESIFGITRLGQIKLLAFDAAGVESAIAVPSVYPDSENVALGPDEFIGIKLPDNDSLVKAELNGKLWMMKPHWHQNPGIVCDNSGTGGNQRNGAALWSLSENTVRQKINIALRELRDYQSQQQRIDITDGTKSVVNTIPVIVCGTELGGMASSGIDDVCRIAGQEAHALKCDVRITRLSLVLGCINPTDREMAARNELLALKRLQVYREGSYMAPIGDAKIHRPICDSVIMLSDSNNDGNINGLDALYSTAANYIFYLLSTPMGHVLRERAVDIEENLLKDDLGGTLSVSTASISKIHIDLPRVIEYCKCRLMTILYDWFLKPYQDVHASKDAVAVAESAKIVETLTQNTTLDRILSFTGLCGADVRQHMTMLFSNLVAGVKRGITGCTELAQASKQIIEVELSKKMPVQIQAEAEQMAGHFAKLVSQRIDIYLDAHDGVSRTKIFLDKLVEIINDLEHCNNSKFDRAIAKSKNISTMLANGHDMLARLRKRHSFIQAISIFKKSAIKRIFRVYTDLAIKNSLECEGRTILKNQLIPLLRTAVTSQSVYVQGIAGKIQVCRDEMAKEAHRLKTMSSVLMVPIGLELARPKFLDRQLESIVTSDGGIDELLKKLYQQFCETIGSLKTFGTDEPIKHDGMLNYCAKLAEQNVTHLNAIDVFRQECQSKLKQRIEMAVKESRGRLRVSGEGGDIIPMIKLIGVCDRSSGEWIVKIANEVDPHSGDWQIVETKDPNSIVFIQQRSRVSLTRIIQECRQFWKEPSDLNLRVQFGSDPIVSLAPGADCSNSEMDAVIAMGLSTGHIKEEASGVMLNHHDDPVLIGRSLPQIREYFRNEYHELIAVYCGFIKGLIATGQNAIKQLDVIAGRTNCKLVSELGIDAFANIRAIADALMPHLRRIKKN
jgi:hypothetical protein